MSGLFEATVLLLVQEIVLFWIILIILFVLWYRSFGILFTSFKPWKINKVSARRKRIIREEEEIKIIQQDLEKRVIIASLEEAPSSSKPKIVDKLLQNGIALNQTLSQRDTDNEKQGDHWLSGGRWLWFMLYQLITGLPVSLPLTIILGSMQSSILGFAFSLGTGIRFGAMIVPEKSRGKITRFGAHVSFLHTGLHFRVPIIEDAEEMSLKNMVWGPEETSSEEASDTNEYHLKGTTGSALNKHPGVMIVALRGTYNLTVTVKITLRVRRADRRAWYWWSYEFTNPEEVGEAIADFTHAIISTKAREIKKKAQKEVKESGQKVSTKEIIGKQLLMFLDKVPEITGKILLGLYEISRERLGGLLPISVAITSVDPPPEFTKLLLRLDTARVRREEQELEGEGRADRWARTSRGLATLAGIPANAHLQPELIRDAIQQDIALEVAQQPTLDAWLKNQVVPTLTDVFKKRTEKKEGKDNTDDE